MIRFALDHFFEIINHMVEALLLSEFIKMIKKIYDEYKDKDSSERPSYVNTIEEILKIDGII